MNPTTPIKNAMNELEVTIRNLSSFPETDNAAICALHAATAARVFLRIALEAATPPDGTQANTDRRATKHSPDTTTPKRQTAGYPFFSCNIQKDKLFSVREGVPLEGALEQVSLFLESAQAIAGTADDATPAAVYGAAYLIEMAKAVVDATVRAAHAEEMADVQ